MHAFTPTIAPPHREPQNLATPRAALMPALLDSRRGCAMVRAQPSRSRTWHVISI